jgi:signal peptidase I
MDKLAASAQQAIQSIRSSDWSKYLLPLGFLLLFAVFESNPLSSVFGVAIFVSIIYALATDFFPPAGKKGAKKAAKPKDPNAALKDLLYSAGAAVALWLLISFALNTSKPLNVVTSCSMLPVLHRGDLVFLQGGDINASTARLYSSSLTQANMQTGTCLRSYADGRSEQVACLKGISLNGQAYPAATGNDVIVYEPVPQVYGLIIHRAVLRLEYGNRTLYLTKGDNNQFLDQQGGITAVDSGRVQGKVIFVVPAIGFLKIFLFAGFDSASIILSGNFGQALAPFAAPPGCDYVMSPG